MQRALGESGTVTLRTRIQRQLTIGNERYRLAAKIDIIDDGGDTSGDRRHAVSADGHCGDRRHGTRVVDCAIADRSAPRLIRCSSRQGGTVSPSSSRSVKNRLPSGITGA